MSVFTRAAASILAILVILAAGVSLGLATAFLAVGSEPPFGAVRSGPWIAWPAAGGPDADPYARAVTLRDGRIPLASGAGLRFVAIADSAGRALLGGCDYAVSGSTPPAQAWTLTLVDLAGFVPDERPGRIGFTSSEVVRDIEGGFVVTVAAQARAGNWLPAGRVERFALMLTVYDTPIGKAYRVSGSAPAMPAIDKGRCG